MFWCITKIWVFYLFSIFLVINLLYFQWWGHLLLRMALNVSYVVLYKFVTFLIYKLWSQVSTNYYDY